MSPLGTEFHSKSNTLVGLLEEQVHRDYDPWTDRKTWTRTDLRCSRTRTSTRVVSYGEGAILDTSSLALRAATDTKSSTPTDNGQAFQACPKGREGSGYIRSYSPQARHLASIRVLKTATSARATRLQGILGVVVSVGKVALVADGRRGGRMGGSL